MVSIRTVIRAGPLAGDLASTNLLEDEFQDPEFSVGNADDKPTIFASMQAREVDRAFAVDQASYIGRNFRGKLRDARFLTHAKGYFVPKAGLPGFLRGVPNWWRRGDS